MLIVTRKTNWAIKKILTKLYHQYSKYQLYIPWILQFNQPDPSRHLKGIYPRRQASQNEIYPYYN